MTDSQTEGTRSMSIHSKEYREAALEVFRAATSLVALTEKAEDRQSALGFGRQSVEYRPRSRGSSQAGDVIVKSGDSVVARVEFDVKDKFSKDLLDEWAQSGIHVEGGDSMSFDQLGVSCMKAALGGVLYHGVFSKSRITKAFNDNPEVFMRAVIELYREALRKPPNDDTDTVRVPA